MYEDSGMLQYQFPWQKKDEKVKMLMRGFLLSLLIPISMILLGFFVPAFIFVFFIQSHWLYTRYQEWINSGILLWFGIGIFWILYLVYEWFFDVCVVTDQRIIDIDQQGFFHQKVSEAGLSKVQDVIYEIRGFIQTFFNFGDVTVYTAGNDEGFTFENVHEPQKVHQKLLAIIEEFSDAQESPVTTRELFEYLKEQRQQSEKKVNKEEKIKDKTKEIEGNMEEKDDQENS